MCVRVRDEWRVESGERAEGRERRGESVCGV